MLKEIDKIWEAIDSAYAALDAIASQTEELQMCVAASCPDKPLTVRQMSRMMEDSEAVGVTVYVVERRTNIGTWAILDIVDGELLAIWGYGAAANYRERDYGKTWLAFENPPEAYVFEGDDDE